MVAIVPPRLRGLYNGRNLEGHLFVLNHVRIDPSFYEYPRHEGYSFIRGDWFILIGDNSNFFRLPNGIGRWFPIYPLVSSIRSLLSDRTTRRMLIGKPKIFVVFIKF